ncbi:MAG: HlyD family efflux transporter periplasmic adaptor subunit [Acidobacteriia bacterium]|nr:HlyD family efflux transporter periplasmic adaptor subunit [Terriglobia bacterium]
MRRRLPLLRTLLVLLGAFLSCAAAILGLWRLDRVVVADGRLAGGSVQICSPRDGVVVEVRVRAGDRVVGGDLLLRLDSRDLESEAAARHARFEGLVAQREERLAEAAKLRESVQPRERLEAEEERDRARVERERVQIEATAARRLGDEGIVGRIQVEKADLDLKLAAISVEHAEHALGLLDAQQRSTLAGLMADARRLEGEVEAERLTSEALVRDIGASQVTAPEGGAVEGGDLAELRGRVVRKGDELLRIGLGAPARFEAALSDNGRAAVRPGQRATIRLDGFPWLIHGSVRATVARVADRRGQTGGFSVDLDLDPVASGPGPLREGMRGTARIVVGETVSLGRLFLERIAGRSAP